VPLVHQNLHAHLCTSIAKCMHTGASCTGMHAHRYTSAMKCMHTDASCASKCACTSQYDCNEMYGHRCLVHAGTSCIQMLAPSAQLYQEAAPSGHPHSCVPALDCSIAGTQMCCFHVSAVHSIAAVAKMRGHMQSQHYGNHSTSTAAAAAAALPSCVGSSC